MTLKKKIIERIEYSDPHEKYYPTKHAITRWFNIMNRSIFRGRLIPFYDVEIRERRKCGAEITAYECPDTGLRWSNLCMNVNYYNFRRFIEALAHEMLHHYQWIIEGNHNMPHNNDFFSWRDYFAEYKLRLGY